MSNLRNNHRYSEETKLQAVRLVLDNGMSSREVAKKLGIRNKTQVNVWVKRFEEGNLLEDRRGRSKENFESLEQENAYLKAQVELLKKHNPNLFGEGCWENKNDLK
jgi:transposase